jgi:hypothetical protein
MIIVHFYHFWHTNFNSLFFRDDQRIAGKRGFELKQLLAAITFVVGPYSNLHWKAGWKNMTLSLILFLYEFSLPKDIALSSCFEGFQSRQYFVCTNLRAM